MQKSCFDAIYALLEVNSKILRKSTKSFRKNWQHGFSPRSYIPKYNPNSCQELSFNSYGKPLAP